MTTRKVTGDGITLVTKHIATDTTLASMFNMPSFVVNRRIGAAAIQRSDTGYVVALPLRNGGVHVLGRYDDEKAARYVLALVCQDFALSSAIKGARAVSFGQAHGSVDDENEGGPR